ncbi:hypothetical protein CYLTODRAFT_421881 [Cylindrobasidium torrendii FP15055 ss-10]|uniref:FAR-17a/AIG1-like protein n=1 Tax=Cylindrobasidium torrendii FP15055 ss-10 TaxID=1314674 RepID=A0A0D7BCZ9_9AGAR|nr:hypothetical protein CYLTODRAFT_421881 [Cylindrobasidium torrendii FP15055 ss-10]
MARLLARVAALVLHVAAPTAMWLAFKSPLDIHHTLGSGYGGMSIFLTIHALFAAIFTMIFGALSDVFPRVTALRSFKRGLMMLAMPLGAVVSTIYWSLLLFFPNLIMPNNMAASATEPSSMDAAPFRIPLNIDLGLHALPGTALVIDFFLFEDKYTAKTVREYALLVAVGATIAYTSWEEYCSSINGSHPYPFLNVPLPIRLCIYAGATGIAYGSFRVLNWLHR